MFRQDIGPAFGARTGKVAIDTPNAGFSDLRYLLEQAVSDLGRGVVGVDQDGKSGRALYFTRSTLYGDGPVWRHIGIYAYRRAALERFNASEPSPLERREKLEQLRALALGMRIDAALVETVPLGVDTPEDLERARQMLAAAP